MITACYKCVKFRYTSHNMLLFKRFIKIKKTEKSVLMSKEKGGLRIDLRRDQLYGVKYF